MRVIVLWLAAGTVIWTSAGCRASDAMCPSDGAGSTSTARPLVCRYDPVGRLAAPDRWRSQGG